MAVNMTTVNRMQTEPIPVPRTRRNHQIAVITSLQAGRCVPIAAIPVLREESFVGEVNISCEMMETHELIANPVTLRVTAYCVPHLAFDRFQGSRDQLDRSYMGQPQIDGGAVVPFFPTAVVGAPPLPVNSIYRYLGLHGKEGDTVNVIYREAYNEIWNFRARNRSREIPLLNTQTNTVIQPAFWQHSRFQHIVPDFDQARIEGAVPIEFLADAAIKNPSAPAGPGTVLTHDRGPVYFNRTNTPDAQKTIINAASNTTLQASDNNPQGTATTYNAYADLTKIAAQMSSTGAFVSLANIEAITKAQGFAAIRAAYEGLEDEYIIDMLMDGLTIPDQSLTQPILLADQTVRFGQAKRYATDSDNLTVSAVSGGTTMNMRIRMPRLETGGVIMLIAECLPEQLWEKQQDPMHYTTTTADLPAYLRDAMDTEKVDIIKNKQIDASHSQGENTFGFAPLNWKWNAFPPRVGGKFYLEGTGNTSERTRFWAVEQVDPDLDRDFYLSTNINLNPFINTTADPFELGMVGNGVLEGPTVFGPVLLEAGDNFAEVTSKIDYSEVAGVPSGTAAARAKPTRGKRPAAAAPSEGESE